MEKANIKTSLTMKKYFTDIQEKLYYMIPEKWSAIYLYASVYEGVNNVETGEMFFYYFPKSILKKEAINVYEVPSKFNIDEKKYFSLTDEIYKIIKKLKKEFQRVNGKKWTNITISIVNNKFCIDYGYEDLKNYQFNSFERHIIWRYIYLKTGLNTYNKKERKIINTYMDSYSFINQKKERYEEQEIYNDKQYNSINYDKEINPNQVLEINTYNKGKIKKEKEENIINQILKY